MRIVCQLDDHREEGQPNSTSCVKLAEATSGVFFFLRIFFVSNAIFQVFC